MQVRHTIKVAWRHRLPFVLCCMLLPAAWVASPVGATTRCVNPGGTSGCFASIQTAVNASSSGDRITVAAGTYTELITIGISLTISGAGAGTTIIDGGNQSGAFARVVTITANTVALSDVTIRNGYYGGVENSGALTLARSALTGSVGNQIHGSTGGGIVNNSVGTLTLSGVTISGNIAQAFGAGYGGGINNAGMLTIAGCMIQQNFAHQNPSADLDGSSGGGIYNTGTVAMTGVVVSGNGASAFGGGIANTGHMTTTSSTISGNVVGTGYGGGGAGVGNNGTLTVVNSTISGNAIVSNGAGDGGILNTGTLTVIGSTVSSNSVGDVRYNSGGRGGGGILNGTGGQAMLTNSTISGNFAGGGSDHTGRGGGIDNRGILSLTTVTLAANDNNGLGADGIAATAGTLTLRDTLLANPGANCFGMVTSSDYNLASDRSCLGLTQPHDRVGVPPLLGPLAYNGGATATQALLAGSPAIDGGGVCCPAGVTMDQRGFPRPYGGGCDIGAYEYTVPQSVPPSRGGGVLGGSPPPPLPPPRSTPGSPPPLPPPRFAPGSGSAHPAPLPPPRA